MTLSARMKALRILVSRFVLRIFHLHGFAIRYRSQNLEQAPSFGQRMRGEICWKPWRRGIGAAFHRLKRPIGSWSRRELEFSSTKA